MSKKPVLVVMAAGMGSRYGGLKQIDPVGSKGEAILDYSIYDAHQAGFETVVIIIKEAIKNDFMEFIAETYEGTMLNLLCSDGDDFIKKRSMLALNIQTQFSSTYEYTLTDSELQELVALWCDEVKANGKYREAYAEYNALRLAKERARMEDY